MPTPIRARKRARTPLLHPGTPVSRRRAQLYSTLGVTEAEVASTPQITHILKELPPTAPRAKDGGITRALIFLRGSSEPDAKKFLAVYDQIPITQRHLLPIEAYCAASALTTKRLLELVTGACFEQSSATTALLAKASHPNVVAATVRNALMWGKDGVRDREMLHKHAGFIPVPKTNVLNVGGDFNQDNRKQIAIGEILGIEETQTRIANRFNERLGLAASVGATALPSAVDTAADEPADSPEPTQPEPEPEWVP